MLRAVMQMHNLSVANGQTSYATSQLDRLNFGLDTDKDTAQKNREALRDIAYKLKASLYRISSLGLRTALLNLTGFAVCVWYILTRFNRSVLFPFRIERWQAIAKHIATLAVIYL